MTSVEPKAYGDVLILLGNARQSILPMSISELHLYSYIGCLLGLVRGVPINDWGYQFGVTSEGFPFSAAFESARKILVRSNLIRENASGMQTIDTLKFQTELEFYESFEGVKERVPFLQAAMDCALALPVGSIRNAIGNSPGFRIPVSTSQRALLLSEDDLAVIYEEYKIIDEALDGKTENLLSPAILWLSARTLQYQKVKNLD